MSDVATVVFVFDGTRDRFDQIYESVCSSAPSDSLDIGTYFHATEGAIEFIIEDFIAFEQKMARYSAEIGVQIFSMNFLLSEKGPNQAPEPTRAIVRSVVQSLRPRGSA